MNHTVKIFHGIILSLLLPWKLFCGFSIEKNVSDRVRKEIEQQLDESDHIYSTTSRDAVKKKVKNEINNQIFSQLSLQEVRKDHFFEDEYEYVYNVPSWPRPARFFLKRDQLSIDINAQFATQAYGSSGDTRDISHLLFQQSPMRLKDIVLASKLLEQGVAQLPTGVTRYKFLEVLRDQSFEFSASTNKQKFDFNYVRHFRKGDISLGLQVPIVRRKNKIRLTSSIATTTNEVLKSECPSFYTDYPNGLYDLFNEILTKKNISFNENDTETGLGDISIFLNLDIPTRFADNFIVGVKGLFPTSKRRDVYKLWDPELGSLGFTEVALFGSALWERSRWLNPHLFMQVTYPFSANVFRRVPKTVSKSDIESIPLAKAKFGEDFMIYGNNVQYVSSEPEFSEQDTTVRRFSDEARKTKIHKGSEFFARIGNTIEDVFSHRLFLDVFYDIRAKGKDYLGYRSPEDPYAPSILTDNSFVIAHRVGVNLQWQPDDSWRLALGGLYTFMGRNTSRDFEIDASINIEF